MLGGADGALLQHHQVLPSGLQSAEHDFQDLFSQFPALFDDLNAHDAERGPTRQRKRRVTVGDRGGEKDREHRELFEEHHVLRAVVQVEYIHGQ